MSKINEVLSMEKEVQKMISSSLKSAEKTLESSKKSIKENENLEKQKFEINLNEKFEEIFLQFKHTVKKEIAYKRNDLIELKKSVDISNKASKIVEDIEHGFL